MKPRVAVICAWNPGNAGMYSVDLAAVDFLTRNNIDFDLFTSHTPPRRGRGKLLRLGIDIGYQYKARFGRLSFKRFSDISQLYKYSHVMYWGDFTPNPVYGYEDFQIVEGAYRMRLTEEQSLDKWARLFNLSAGEIAPGTIAVGNNFQHNFAVDSHRYKKYIRNLGSNFDLILPRDIYSVDNLKTFLPASAASKVRPGLDPAFLLNDTSENKESPKEDIFCYRFVRSNLPSAEHYVSELEKASGCRGVHLSNWTRLGDQKETDYDSLFLNYISDIKRSQFVITDLYHLAINAMRLNVPVFCLGNKTESQEGSLGDFKKKILFKMLGLEQYYIEVDSVGATQVDDVVGFIERELGFYKEHLSDIYKQKDQLVKEFDDRLLAALMQS